MQTQLLHAWVKPPTPPHPLGHPPPLPARYTRVVTRFFFFLVIVLPAHCLPLYIWRAYQCIIHPTQIPTPTDTQPSTSVPPPTWTCTACTTANKLSVTECTGCGNERVQPATRGKTLSNQLDVQSCSAEDAYQALLIRFHFSINHLLEDAGMTVVVERGKIQVRSEASAVIAAARRNGHKKLHRLALLLQGGFCGWVGGVYVWCAWCFCFYGKHSVLCCT